MVLLGVIRGHETVPPGCRLAFSKRKLFSLFNHYQVKDASTYNFLF
jgi:hypothetical protein